MMIRCLLIALTVFTLARAESFTRGPGVYPGRPSESAAPALRPGPDSRRNLALNRPAEASSSWDRNLTAQLATDGILETAPVLWTSVSDSQRGELPARLRERLFDDNWVSVLELDGPGAFPEGRRDPWVQVRFGGDAPAVDRVEVQGLVKSGILSPENWACRLLASGDGSAWRELGRASGMARPSGEFLASLPFGLRTERFYRVELLDARAVRWEVQEIRFWRGTERVRPGGPWNFRSAWKSAGPGREWIQVDLGVPSRIDRVVLHWLARPAEGEVLASDDGRAWTRLAALPARGASDDLAVSGRARYVRLALERAATPDGYVLSELEVWGRGGLVPVPAPIAPVRPGSALDLAGGAWRVQRASRVEGDGAAISAGGFKDLDWIPATVPGTVLASYVNAGALAEPTRGDGFAQVSDAFFNAPFWYRDTFQAAPLKPGERRWLCFDGVDWKAEVWLNGARVGRVEGAFARGRFDVTSLLRPGGTNVLAVRIEPPPHPGSAKVRTLDDPGLNGGVLGADSPTFMASVGWDWMPTIPGRNAGLWDRVWIRATGPAVLEDPLVAADLAPDNAWADLAVSATVRNTGSEPVSGALEGRFGDIGFRRAVTVPGGASVRVRLDKASDPALHLASPRLWWPNGYGDPWLYDVELRFVPGGGVPGDAIAFRTGIRRVLGSTEGSVLRLWVNGRRFVPKGGNWGFPEALLRYRSREFDAALAYHRDMNFNMVRDWTGMVAQDAFYDACDRNGILVWQDFWLANPWDGADPDDPALFLANAEGLVRRIRNHPCLGLYCGRNEGNPPRDLELGLRAILARDHPGIPFVPSSADGPVGGYGPYRALPPGAYEAPRKLHSEMGMPVVPVAESLRLMLPEPDLWPMGRLWGVHDFTLGGAQDCAGFLELVRRAYGPARSAEEWSACAQFQNYDGYRAMFEAQNRSRMGLLVWMSHPAWPSLVWQSYDYYLAPTAALFGAKKACEPLHIQLNEATGQVELVNTSAGPRKGLACTAKLLALDGRVLWERTVPADAADDTLQVLFMVERPWDLPPVHLLRLTVTQGTEVLSSNAYLRGSEPTDTQELRDLPPARITVRCAFRREGEVWKARAEIANAGSVPAMLLDLAVVRDKGRDRILPVRLDDDFFHLLPGERRQVDVEVRQEDTRGERPVLRVGGLNLPAARFVP
jgi:hypothetical protein